MMCSTMNRAAVEIFLHHLRSFREMEEDMTTMNDGSTYKWNDELGDDDPRAYEYKTCSGKGRYWVEDSPDGLVLYFEGFRNSFKGGCDLINPREFTGWVLLESSQPERGVWE